MPCYNYPADKRLATPKDILSNAQKAFWLRSKDALVTVNQASDPHVEYNPLTNRIVNIRDLFGSAATFGEPPSGVSLLYYDSNGNRNYPHIDTDDDGRGRMVSDAFLPTVDNFAVFTIQSTYGEYSRDWSLSGDTDNEPADRITVASGSNADPFKRFDVNGGTVLYNKPSINAVHNELFHVRGGQHATHRAVWLNGELAGTNHTTPHVSLTNDKYVIGGHSWLDPIEDDAKNYVIEFGIIDLSVDDLTQGQIYQLQGYAYWSECNEGWAFQQPLPEGHPYRDQPPMVDVAVSDPVEAHFDGNVRLYHTVDGGELGVVNQQIEMNGGLETAAYLSLFGGNESGAEWWGNDFVTGNTSDRQVSETQRLIYEIPATSANIRRLEDAVRRDLNWMITDGVAKSVEANVRITGVGRVEIVVVILSHDAEYKATFSENWKSQ
jgi:phage gp46-like protein